MDIEKAYYSGEIEKASIGFWPGSYGYLYLMPNELVFVSTIDNAFSFKCFSFDEWLNDTNIQQNAELINSEDYDEIENLIALLKSKEKARLEVENIVSGVQKLTDNDLFLPMKLHVKGSKISAFVIGLLGVCCLVVALLFSSSWLKADNSVDRNIFMAVGLSFWALALAVLFIDYYLFFKIKKINNKDSVYGIWLTKYFLICKDAEGLNYTPVLFFKGFKAYQSSKAHVLIAESKPPFSPVYMVCNFLPKAHSPESLEKLLTQKMIELAMPTKYLKPIEEAIRYADGQDDSLKMDSLSVRLQKMIQVEPANRVVLQKIATYVDSKLAHWNDNCRVIPENWVFVNNLDEKKGYQASEDGYAKSWNEPEGTGHWLMCIGRIFIIETKELEFFLGSPTSNNKMTEILARCPLKKIILIYPLREDKKRWIKEAFANQPRLKDTEIVFVN